MSLTIAITETVVSENKITITKNNKKQHYLVDGEKAVSNDKSGQSGNDKRC